MPFSVFFFSVCGFYPPWSGNKNSYWDNDRGAEYIDPEDPSQSRLIGTEYYVIKTLEIYSTNVHPCHLYIWNDDTLPKLDYFIEENIKMLVILFGGRWAYGIGPLRPEDDITITRFYRDYHGRVLIIGTDYTKRYGGEKTYHAKEFGIVEPQDSFDYSPYRTYYEGKPGSILDGYVLEYSPYDDGPKKIVYPVFKDPSVPGWADTVGEIMIKGDNLLALGSDGLEGDRSTTQGNTGNGAYLVMSAEFSALRDSTTGTKYDLMRRIVDDFFPELLFVFDPGSWGTQESLLMEWYDDSILMPAVLMDSLHNYDIFIIKEDGTKLPGPRASELAQYDKVMWYTGGDYTYPFIDNFGISDTINLDSAVNYYHVDLLYLGWGLADWAGYKGYLKRIFGLTDLIKKNYSGGHVIEGRYYLNNFEGYIEEGFSGIDKVRGDNPYPKVVLIYDTTGTGRYAACGTYDSLATNISIFYNLGLEKIKDRARSDSARSLFIRTLAKMHFFDDLLGENENDQVFCYYSDNSVIIKWKINTLYQKYKILKVDNSRNSEKTFVFLPPKNKFEDKNVLPGNKYIYSLYGFNQGEYTKIWEREIEIQGSFVKLKGKNILFNRDKILFNFYLSGNKNAKIYLTDILGRKIQEVKGINLIRGINKIQFGLTKSSKIYLLRIESGNLKQTRKIISIK